MTDIISKLDLGDFIARFKGYFARDKSLEIMSDLSLFKLYIDELDKITFSPPSDIKELSNEIILLQKRAILKQSQIFEFVKIIKYFLYLKGLNLSNFKYLPQMLFKITIPQAMLDISNTFDNLGEINSGIYLELDSINDKIMKNKQEIKKQLSRILSNAKLSPYLVDRQFHLLDSKECLLLSSGFNSVLEGSIVHRTQAGYFYVLPHSLNNIYTRLDKLYNEREMLLYNIERDMTESLREHILFLKFINKEFDKFDSLQARVMFARDNNFNFLYPSKKRDIILRDFYHPNIANPIPCNINFTTKILLITGVNAGGKTMLLKSILSVAFLAKYLIPFRINNTSSKIPYFDSIYAIISDPQNSKDDISTFAGRMLEFSKLVESSNLLLGIDEIELGTDAAEASALYFAMLEYMQNRDIKIVITTHHKILASKMANNPNVSLIAALYDEANSLPTYSFLEGCVGKSYAFESALRYKIPRFIINRAKEIYGEDLENLNELIEQTSMLKASLLKKELEISEVEKKIANKACELDMLINKQNEELRAKKLELESIYNKALGELKAALKSNDAKEMHRFLNAQHKALQKIPKESKSPNINLKQGDRIYHGKNIGTIISIKGDMANIELDNGVRARANLSSLKLANAPKKERKIEVLKSAKSCNVSLDLHGKRVEEALELLEQYISDCLLVGYDEVLIYHGIGGGVLANVVREFLSKHPKVKSFTDAPASSGGFGAKVVRF